MNIAVLNRAFRPFSVLNRAKEKAYKINMHAYVCAGAYKCMCTHTHNHVSISASEPADWFLLNTAQTVFHQSQPLTSYSSISYNQQQHGRHTNLQNWMLAWWFLQKTPSHTQNPKKPHLLRYEKNATWGKKCHSYDTGKHKLLIVKVFYIIMPPVNKMTFLLSFTI
jgi:hypothetical protein